MASHSSARQIYLNPDKNESRVLCPLRYSPKAASPNVSVMSALCQKRTFRRLLDKIDNPPGRVLKFAEHHHEASPPQIFAYGRGRRRVLFSISRRVGA